MSSQKIGTINGEGEFQKDKEANQVWFEEDLEFVQSLANPHFVQELTLNGILGSEPMINYLHSPQFQTMMETQDHAQLLTDKFLQNWISLRHWNYQGCLDVIRLP
ncbi:hypothetical protein PCANC_16410 [Puccinia coronata f. sp. avenae]|uniref:Mediator of RNA polymerase II transcription subunit 31 n=1 Tax=Puccinia coronata f. sp. avenae TaxID=200324 RepID=A0A2N5SYJ7_9BASI|nr:hypothetical protein PCANC_16410 [Puccinia coronata f. sp. avenae]